MNFKQKFILLSPIAALVIISTQVNADSAMISGSVKDSHGRVIENALVTVVYGADKGADGSNADGSKTFLNKLTETIYTDHEGRYRHVKAGFSRPAEQVIVQARGQGSGSYAFKEIANSKQADVVLDAVLTGPADFTTNEIIEALPEDKQAKGTFLMVCSGCHLPGSQEVWNFAQAIEGIPDEYRETTWLNTFARMDALFSETFSYSGATDSPLVRDGGQGIFIKLSDREVLAPYLAANYLPSHIEKKIEGQRLKKVATALGPEKGTRVVEYHLPEDDHAWYREVVNVKDTRVIWGTDMYGDRLFKVTLGDGELEWVDVPGENTGPHTLNRGQDDKIWIALEGLPGLGTFDPETGVWEKFSFSKSKSSNLASHDIAIGPGMKVIPDKKGRVYLSLLSTNQIAQVDVATKNIKFIDLPVPSGKDAAGAVLYGMAYSPSSDLVFWSQLRGNVGQYNPTSGAVDVLYKFPDFVGPRRMAVDEHDRLWIPLYGTGEVLAHNITTGKEIGRYSLPDGGVGAYGVSWDEKRQRLWVATVGADAIYSFNPSESNWRRYPLPSKGAIFRVLTIDDEGRIWGSYSTRGKIGMARPLSRENVIVGIIPGEG